MNLQITKEWLTKRAALEDGCEVHACNCIGPQNGAPVCPCRMRNVAVVNGRYVEVNDLGAAPSKDKRTTDILIAAKSLEPKL